MSSTHHQQPAPVDAEDTGKDWTHTENDVRHTKADAINERQFEAMVRTTYDMDDDYFAYECRLVLFACGRLGMRPGEVAHMQEDWIDWENDRIEIPTYEQCTDGRDGGICGHCKQAAEQMAHTRTENALDAYYQTLDTREQLEPTRTGLGFVVDPDQFKAQMWSPKTENAARKIPYGVADTRAALAVEDYFQRYDSFEASRGVVNRRVTKMAEKTNGIVDPDEIYPHALRSTAASFWVARGLGAINLKALFGWSQFATAICYLEESPERLEAALSHLRH